MSDLENVYKLNRYFYMDSYQKILKYKKYCIISNCEKNASFNYKDSKDPIYCNTHKFDSMINVKNQMWINIIVYYVINIFQKIIIFLKNI